MPASWSEFKYVCMKHNNRGCIISKESLLREIVDGIKFILTPMVYVMKTQSSERIRLNDLIINKYFHLLYMNVY